MNTEQERADFEAWAIKERIAYRDEKHGVCFYNGQRNSYWIGYQAGRAALQSQDRGDAALAEILREAAAIIEAIHPEFPPRNMRRPIVDELEGFALMLDHARRIEETK